jgi:hypothetical protein
MWGLSLLRTMQADYLGFVSRLQFQHTDIAQVRVLNEHITHVFHPDWVRQVLVDQADALIRWERATEVFSVSMGQSVLVTEGATWQRQTGGRLCRLDGVGCPRRAARTDAAR